MQRRSSMDPCFSSSYALPVLLLCAHLLLCGNHASEMSTLFSPPPPPPIMTIRALQDEDGIGSSMPAIHEQRHLAMMNRSEQEEEEDLSHGMPGKTPSPSLPPVPSLPCLMNHSHGQAAAISNERRTRIGARKLVLLPTLKELATASRILVVSKHGSKGSFKSVQSAVDSVPDYNQHWVYIIIDPGVYYEKVTIPYNKPYIAFQGAGRSKTVISWTDRASSFGTANSATFTANSPSFIAKGVGFRNAAPPPAPGAYGGQAVAVLLNGDMMAFYECGFYGAQDTLFDYSGRHYFKDCRIQGSIDFIFGHAQSFYRGCELVVTAQSGYLSGSITAHNRDRPDDSGGFVFVGCTVVGTGQVYLGRAWGAYSRVVFLYTYMSDIIVPDGWYDWGQPSRQGTVFYAQYKCTGPGSNTGRRVGWSHELTDAQAQPFLQLSFIDADSWLQET